jgi:DNA repair protein RadD
MQLRDYQHEAINALFSYFERARGNPLLVCPTGSGKAVIQAFFLKKIFEQWPDQKIICLTHVKELIEQNYSKLITIAPSLNVGVYSASLNSRDSRQSITFAGIQSVYKLAAEFGRVDLVIVDESHLIPKKGQGMYRRFISELMEINPRLKIVGMSATPFRLDSGYLHKGDGALFTDLAFNLPIVRLLDAGHLCPVITKGSANKIDCSKIKKNDGEFVLKEMDQEARKITSAAVSEIVGYGENRRAWLIFFSSVEHAKIVRNLLLDLGINAATVNGATPKLERSQIITAFKAGHIQALTNVDVLTTGLDVPPIDLVVFLRATASPSLYLQMCGRGMRPHPGKKNCLVLDFAGNVVRHGPIDNVQIKSNGSGGSKSAEQVLKECLNCFDHVSRFETVCPSCGEPFSVDAGFMPQHDASATDAAILSSQIKPEPYSVDKMQFRRHEKDGKPDSVRVSYICGPSVFNVWVCIEHGGYARDSAYEWLRQHHPGGDMPHTTDDILLAGNEGEFKKPTQILVKQSGKYPEIVDFFFNGQLREAV